MAQELANRRKDWSAPGATLIAEVSVDWQSLKKAMKRLAHDGEQSVGGASPQPAGPQHTSFIILSCGVVETSFQFRALHCGSTRWM